MSFIELVKIIKGLKMGRIFTYNLVASRLRLAWFVFLLFAQFHTSSAQSYTWGNVAFGGGGFVTGTVGHKTSGDVYCRTDVGGAYRWDAASSKWIPLLDWNSDQETTYQGVEALALDPQNPNNVYMLAATSYWNGGKTAILKSTDKGSTFSTTIVTTQFTAHGNGMGRSNGERLAVDPNNSNILFCGTRANGLWKSTNGGSTWTLAWNGVTTTTNGNGICFVVFDPSSVSGGVTQTIYIGISRTGSNNIYKSTDGGSTFTAIQPITTHMPHRAALSADNSTLYVVMADAEGPWNPGSGRVYKLATSTGTWTNITPSGNNLPYGGVSVDQADKNRVIVSTINVYSNNHFGQWGDNIYLSTDGGSTWSSKLTSTSIYNNNGIAWCSGQIHWAGSVEFDPLNPAKVRVISGNGIFTCDNINAATTTWKFDVVGLEETVPLDAVSITGGPFVSVIGDYDGAVHSNITAYPANRHIPSMGSTTGIAYAAASTSKLVRVGSAMYYSTNQGSSWTQTTAMNGSSGKVALSADGSVILHCPNGSNTTYRSINNGGAWTNTGLSITDAIPVADMVNTNKFYAYNSGTGVMYVSTNAGVSFAAGGSMTSAWNSSRLIRTVPGNEGHIWVANGDQGLSYSTNSGTSFTKLANVSYCVSVGLGKVEPSSTYPAIYIWGTVGGVRGIFRSIDQGANWVRINDDAHEFGGTGNGNFVMGDMNVYGRVYMSTVGRGIVYGELSGPQPLSANAGTDVTICQGSTQLTGAGSGGTSPYTYTWSPATGAGLSSSTIYNPVASPTTTTTYTLTVKDAVNATATDAVTVTVTPGTSIPFSQNFEGTYPPAGWTDGGGAAPDFSQTSAVVECAGGTKGAWVDTRGSGTAGTISEIVTPSLSFIGYTSTQLSFDYAMKNYDGNPQNNPTGDKYDNFDVLISVCGGSYTSLSSVTTTAYQQVAYSDPALGDCQNRVISLSAYDGMGGIKIMFRVTDNDGNNVYLDNINITGAGGLPVSLLTFDGQYDGDNSVKLNWSVTYETEMKGYRLFRASNISQDLWEEIGFVSSVNSGSGIENYYYYDVNPPPVLTLYYKLASIENNGEITESRIISLNRQETETCLTAYPNPTDHLFNVTIDGGKDKPHVLQVYDIIGRTLEEINMPSGTSAIAIGQNLLPGVYFLKLKEAGYKTIKLIKQ
jgi:xyloglucan-specific exo-beta-1,4-glucanase